MEQLVEADRRAGGQPRARRHRHQRPRSSRIDVDALDLRVDVDGVVDRVDVQKIIDRVDVEKIIERVDVEKIIQRVDIDSLVEQTELGTIIAQSTSGVASEVLDVIRAQGVGLDDFFARWVNRVLRRSPARLAARSGDPGGPAAGPRRAGRRGRHDGRDGTGRSPSRGVRVTTPGGSAGWWPSPPMWVPRGGCSPWPRPASAFAIQLVSGRSSTWPITRSLALVAAVIWEFVYFAYQWTLSGKTIGMAVLGIRVVKTDGTTIGARQAVIRTLTFPLSFIVFGLGFLGILTNRDRHAWHDHFAGRPSSTPGTPGPPGCGGWPNRTPRCRRHRRPRDPPEAVTPGPAPGVPTGRTSRSTVGA